MLSPHFLSREKQTEVKEPEIAEKRKTVKQAGDELGQAQLKLRLDFNEIQFTFGFYLFDSVDLVGWALYFKLD